MSSRAITFEILKEIYGVKEKPCNKLPRPIQQKPHRDRSLDDWGGPRARNQVRAIMALSFFCLLRSDEALNLRSEGISVNPQNLTLNLRSRKTSPFGVLISFSSPFVNSDLDILRLSLQAIHLMEVRWLSTRNDFYKTLTYHWLHNIHSSHPIYPFSLYDNPVSLSLHSVGRFWHSIYPTFIHQWLCLLLFFILDVVGR